MDTVFEKYLHEISSQYPEFQKLKDVLISFLGGFSVEILTLFAVSVALSQALDLTAIQLIYHQKTFDCLKC
jgi:hypothetical protein